MTVADRLGRLTELSDRFTGIDFVRVEERCEQTTLRVYFVTDPSELTVPFAGPNAIRSQDVVLRSVTDPKLPPPRVLDVSGVLSDAQTSRAFIEIQLAEPGEFGLYRLRLNDPAANPSGLAEPFARIDPFFNDVVFSFKTGCEDNHDCAPLPVDCPPESLQDFPVDYLARDFVSFRNALLDFAAQRYPEWTLPIEADVGMMLAESMAALADEFAYMQDRHAREAFLETANQRRSLRKKARLLDYEIHDGLSATTLLELVIDPALEPPTGAFVRAGQRLWAPSETLEPIPFEIGLGLFDREEGSDEPRRYLLKAAWNASELSPYWFDDAERCLPIGATALLIQGELVPEELTGRTLLLRSEPLSREKPARRAFVRVVRAEPVVDPLAASPVTLTRVHFAAEDALLYQLDQTELALSLNVVPASAGRTREQRFIRGATFDPGYLPAVERRGPRKSDGVPRPAIVMLGLSDTEAQGLGFLGPALRRARPELEVIALGEAGDDAWTWVRSILEAQAQEEVFTLEDGVWRRVRAFRGAGEEFVHHDYATGGGFSVRFGDGEFGVVPDEAQRFLVRYRSGPGSRANVPEGAVSLLSLEGEDDSSAALPEFVVSARNPLPVTNGVDPETSREIKLLVPEAYRAELLFALRPEDYAEQAQKLDFVQRAQATPRWTGSWQSMFVAPDPLGSFRVTAAERDELATWLDCVRQTGRDVIVADAKTLAIDVRIHLCIEKFAYASQVAQQVQEVLLGRGRGSQPKGFFHPDNLSFGVPLRRSALEAAIQSVPGVRSVREIFVRQRGLRREERVLGLTLDVLPDQILRLDNDPLHPEAGSLRLVTEGGA